MRIVTSIVTLGLVGALSIRAFADEPTVDRKPLSIIGFSDFGQVVSGKDVQDKSPSGANYTTLDMDLLQRMGVAVTQRTIVDQKFDMQVGIGGLFWYSFPHRKGQPNTQSIKFGPGIARADAVYSFGDPGQSHSQIQFGYFRYKYNTDAVNLGEYLFRSNAYPGVIKTGDWTWINASNYEALGARIGWKHLDGKLSQDLLLFTERNNWPRLSFSPGYIINWKSSIIQLGAGVSWQHLIPIRPSELEPHDPISTYVKMSNFPAIPTTVDSIQIQGDDDKTIYSTRGHQGGPIEGLEVELSSMKDGNGGKPYDEKLLANKGTGALVIKEDPDAVANPGNYQVSETYRYQRTKEYVTFRGIKAMVSGSINLSKAMGFGADLESQDFKVFAEIAVLGIKDQPYYYEDISKRIPIMVGVNLPTFGFLESFGVQMEYYGNDFANSQNQLLESNNPVWTIPENNPNLRFPDRFKDDNIKWSVQGSRNLVPGLSMMFQAASDHLRTRDESGYESRESVLRSPKDWYYMVRVSYGI